MTSDQWVKERATDLADFAVGERHNKGMYAVVTEVARAALQEAIEREQERYAKIAVEVTHGGFMSGRQSILARLRNPDEAMVELATVTMFGPCEARETKIKMKKTIRAIAAHLDEKEKADG